MAEGWEGDTRLMLTILITQQHVPPPDASNHHLLTDYEQSFWQPRGREGEREGEEGKIEGQGEGRKEREERKEWEEGMISSELVKTRKRKEEVNESYFQTVRERVRTSLITNPQKERLS